MRTKLPAAADHTQQAAEKATSSSGPSPSMTGAEFLAPSAGLMAPHSLLSIASNSARVAQLARMRGDADALPPGREEPQPMASRPPARSHEKGLPADLQRGIETLSGISMDHVTVHYNSSRPAQMQALAIAQGSEIHLGPGQEEHLPHEAWHVVQQAQGRVRPTVQMKAGVSMNNDAGLEAEADVMGARARSMNFSALRQRGALPLAHPQAHLLHAGNMPVQPRLIMAIPSENKGKYTITDYSEPFRKRGKDQTRSVPAATNTIEVGTDGATAESKEASAASHAATLQEAVGKVMAHLDSAIAEQVASLDAGNSEALAGQATSAAESKQAETKREGRGKHDPSETLAEASAIREQFNKTEIRSKVKVQLGKWIEDKAGDPSGKHPEFGRKMQLRIYTSYYDLARALLGWVLAKPGRTEEKNIAKEVYENTAVQTQLNSLMIRLNQKIAWLGPGEDRDADGKEVKRNRGKDRHGIDITEERGTAVIKELGTDMHGRGGQYIGGYLKHFRTRRDIKGNPMGSKMGRNLLGVTAGPDQYGLTDKMIAWHDITEYLYGTKPHLQQDSLGIGLLQDASGAETKSTLGIDKSGKRLGEGTSHRGIQELDNSTALRVQMGNETDLGADWQNPRDESHPLTKFARKNRIPIWSGQSYTAMRMFKMAQWAGATREEMTALAWSVFAFWRLAYDHTVAQAYHTLHEVMDLASNFGVEYQMKPIGQRGEEFRKVFGGVPTAAVASGPDTAVPTTEHKASSVFVPSSNGLEGDLEGEYDEAGDIMWKFTAVNIKNYRDKPYEMANGEMSTLHQVFNAMMNDWRNTTQENVRMFMSQWRAEFDKMEEETSFTNLDDEAGFLPA